MKKRILAISKRPCFPLGMGGAEMSMTLLLLQLKKIGNFITIIGQISPEKKDEYIRKISKLYQNYRVEENKYGFIIRIDDTLKFAIISSRHFYLFSFLYIDTWKPDFIFTQLDGSSEINSFANDRDIQTFHFFRDISNPDNFNLLLAKNSDPQKINFISNSHFVKDHYRKTFGINSNVSYPLPLQCHCNNSLKKREERVLKFLYINPNPCKGVEIVLALAEFFKRKAEFHVVEGWYKEDFISILNNPNIIAYKKQISLCNLYNHCDVLLVPTQLSFPEAYCRVAVEGLQHGMTVIASKFTGLIESVANGGILIEKFWDANDWIKTILHIMDNDNLLDEYFIKSKKQFIKLYEQDPVDPVIECIK